ncbi:MAG: hypothetical protein DYG98_23135 [Haliscomenobacteraceae bacterium CHB4]|nr:hypothetical protein [Saprospiraceae bacterium]MCE7925954.1 hypothetical protein [Haliscomenobacteraceae bacterium CHB4]
MKQEFTHTDLMDRCLRRELDAAEQADFERRLRDDPAFAAEWDAFRDLVTAIETHSEQELRKTIFQVQKKLETEQFFSTEQSRPTVMKNQTFFRKLMAAAAAIAVLAAALYLYNTRTTTPSSSEWLAKFEQTDKERLGNILDRLEAAGFANPEQGRNDSLAQALQLYEKGDYEKARIELVQYCRIYPDDKIARHYLGMSLLQQSEYAKAASQLSTLAGDPEFELRHANKWYLALCYLQFGTPEGRKDARTLLQQLADDPESGYSREAKAYLKVVFRGKDSK